MAQRRPKPTISGALTLYAGAIVVDADLARDAEGDMVAAYAEDARLGEATLRRLPGRSPRLVATIQLGQAPLLEFPVMLRAQNERTGAEIGSGIRLADASTLLAAAGPAVGAAELVGLSSRTVAFRLSLERLTAYPRRITLSAGGTETDAVSQPGPAGTHSVTFTLAEPPAAGTTLVLMDAATSTVVLETVLDAPAMLNAAMARITNLETQFEALGREHASLRRAIERATIVGAERLLLDRLDLFYLLLSDRLDRALRVLNPPAPPLANAEALSWHYGPGDVEGVGLYDLETNGRNDWRWFGPSATVVFRDVPKPVGRAVLAFHDFGPNGADPTVAVTIGTVPVRADLSPARDEGYILDVPVPSGTRFAEGLVILHLAFGHHHTSEADPRLLSAVFSGAELFAA